MLPTFRACILPSSSGSKCTTSCFEKHWGRGEDGVGFGAPFGLLENVDRECCTYGSFKGLGILKEYCSAPDVLERSPIVVFTRPVPGEQLGWCSLFTNHSTLGIEALLTNTLNKRVNSLKWPHL